MHFKRLELIGFKSFAEETRLHFEPGVTAVVGPNGCGKCVSGSSLVQLADGRVEKIQTLVESALKSSQRTERLDDGFCTYENSQDISILSLNASTLKIERKPVRCFIKRRSPDFLLNIKTKSGKEVNATHYHPLFAIKNGRIESLKAEEVREGVKVAMPRHLKTSGYDNCLEPLTVLEKFSYEDFVYVSSSRQNPDKQALNASVASESFNKADHTALLEIPTELKSRSTGRVTSPVIINEALARFLGYVISEGRNTASNQVWFVNNDDSMVADFCRVAKESFGVETRVASYKPNAKDVLIFSKALCKYLEKVFGIGIGQNSAQKRIPPQIFAASKDVISEFLSALFEGDGYICTNRQRIAEGKDKLTPYIEYSTASKKLAEGVVTLLLRLGVQALLREKVKYATNTENKTKRVYYSAYVYGAGNLKQLAGKLRFVGKKKEKLEIIKGLRLISNPNIDVVPSINTLMRTIIKRAGINVKKIKKICPKLQAYYENRCEASRDGILEVLAVVEEHAKFDISGLKGDINRLKLLATSDILWDEVIKVEKVDPQEWVYDLSVEGNHNFIANNFFVHNSNISDAIKWAFGEQSAKSLRASRMEDVIFNGTDNVEPISMAEVSVTFSNESKILPIEYDEVTITRRLFRSGESEYLLNKMPVRLKDIQELLMGTGIGTESYSLIEQGQIDLILSSKPEERRFIFEEASGITRYKSKKKEALNKLEHTENNLIRVNDIISEVKRQIASIERQARKAERYKQEFERLKELDTKFSFFSFKDMRGRERMTSVEIEDIKGKEQDLIGRIARFNELIEKLRTDLDLISERYSTLQASLMEATSAIDKGSHRISVNTERIKELKQLAVTLTEEIERADQRRTSFESTLQVLRQKTEGFTGEKQAKEEFVKQKEGEHDSLSKEIEAHQKDIASGKIQAVENLAKQSRLNNESTRFATEIQNRSSRLRRLQIEIDKVNEEGSSTQSEFNQIDGETQKLEETLSGLNEERNTRQQELDSRRKKLEELNNELASCLKELSLSRSRLQFLEELIQSYEGFDKGARFILEAKKSGMFSNVEGPLCNIIDAEEGMVGALELALGDHLQSFIVRNRTEARELLAYLESNDLGRASIIISEDLPVAAREPLTTQAPLKPMSGAVNLKEEYRPALSYLLQDCYLAEDKEADLFALAEIAGSNAKIITSEGKLVQRGRICGGVRRKVSDTSLVGRENRIHQTRFKIEAFGEKIEELKAAVQGELSGLQAVEGEIALLTDKTRREEISLANINTKRQAVKERLDRLNDEKLVVGGEIDELKELLQELQGRQENAGKELEEIGQKQQALEELISGSQDAIERKSKLREELLIELTQQRTELSSLVREEESRRESLSREESAFSELTGGIESKSRQMAEGSRRIKELEEENGTLTLQNSENSFEKDVLEKEIGKIREEKAGLMEKVALEDKQAQEEKGRMEQLREEFHKLEISRNEISYKQSSLKERVFQAYKMDLEQAQIQIEDDTNWEDVKSQIEELKAKLEKMGTVNLVAIEEHQELQERFNFLTHQEQDLAGAKESLLKAIQKINKTTRALFVETFTKIQEEFKGFFRLLFGGGQAELLLLDEHDILESGIEIIVRPPGKKLQNITLLSGGEKALTAIALLFAIFKVKPSPFCILDEIDAALDESNVNRFSGVLKDFVKNSQFIIVTHNKKTIELADVMYGITMQKSGISRIVSVKFADSEKEKKKEQILA